MKTRTNAVQRAELLLGIPSGPGVHLTRMKQTCNDMAADVDALLSENGSLRRELNQAHVVVESWETKAKKLENALGAISDITKRCPHGCHESVKAIGLGVARGS